MIAWVAVLAVLAWPDGCPWVAAAPPPMPAALLAAFRVTLRVNPG
jgi:hypothetical protein